ncbi:MAG: molybdopterin-binding protein, partial [Mycobacteriales bacterium]
MDSTHANNNNTHVRAGIVATGTELLSGVITDRNGPWLAQQLERLGVEVVHTLCVGDRPADLLATLEFLAEQRVDLIVTSGGLGPTADDVTTEVVAEFAGVELKLDEALEQQIADIIARFRLRSGPTAGTDPSFDAAVLRAANRKQAMVPYGAHFLHPVGTAPGLVLPVAAGPTVIVLPGPPRELQAMWPTAIATPPARALLARAQPYES